MSYEFEMKANKLPTYVLPFSRTLDPDAKDFEFLRFLDEKTPI